MSSISVRRILTAALTAALVLMQVPSSLWPQLAAYAPTTALALDGNAAVVGNIAVTQRPTAAAVNKVTNVVYVASQGASTATNGTLTVISGAQNAVLTTITVGANPSDVVVNELTNKVYVVNNGSSTVSVVDGATNTVTATIASGNVLHGAIDPGRSRLYITTSSGLRVYDTGTNAQVASRSGGYYGVGVNTVTNRIYLGAISGNTVTVVDGANIAGTALATIAVTGGEPNGIVANETTDRIYVSSASGGPLSVIDGRTNTVIGTITLAPTASATEGLSVDAGRNRLYVAHESASKLAIIDTTADVNTVLAQVTVGTFPQDAAVNTNTDRVYLPNASSDSVSVVGVPALPDLVPAGVTVTPSVVPGGTVSYSWTVTNQGLATATATATSWADQAWISTSQTSIAGAYPAGGIVAPNSLAPGASYSRSFSATVGAIPPGSYYFIIQTDSNGQIGESNESNNLSGGVPITVTGSSVTVSAEVREDLDRDGVQDVTEPLLTAPKLEVFRVNADGSRTLVGSAVNSPNLTVSGIADGTFVIVETDPTGYVSTTPNSVTVTLGPGGSASHVFLDTAVLARLAYVYKTSTASRDEWTQFLNSRGYAVDALTETAAETADLSPYRAILIGTDTGDGDPRLDPWGTPAAVANITGSGKPIVGLGDGGSQFFDAKAGGTSNLGWLQSAYSSGSAVIAVNGGEPAWTTPLATGVVSGGTATLYTASNTILTLYAPATLAGVTRIGRGVTDTDHYPVASAGCDVHWGFTASAASLTLVGKQLFENLIAPCGAGPRILDARVSVSAGVASRSDVGDEIALTFDKAIDTSLTDNVIRVTDGDGGVYDIACNGVLTTGNGLVDATCTWDSAQLVLRVRMLGDSALESAASHGTGPIGLQWPGTIVGTTGITDVAGTVVDLATSADLVIDLPGVRGIARYRETPNGTTIVDVVLAGATVTLLKPDGTKDRLTAGADGTYAFPALTPNTAYTVGYDGTAGLAPNDRHYVTGVRFTTDASGGASVPSPQAVFNRGNHTWISAFPLPNNTPVPDQVWRRGQATWYRFAITPQQSVTIELTNCPFNCDLVVYRDLRQVAARLLADAQTQAGIRLSLSGDIMADDLDADDLDADDLDADDLDADDLDADDLDADDLDADDLDADDLDADDLDADDLDADDLDADDLDADDLDADDLDADDLDADDLDADDLDADDLDAAESATYVAAQRKGLRAASLTPGLANETVVINTRDLTGDLYIRVAGGSSLSGVFTISARQTTDAACVTAPLVSRQPSTTFGGSALGKRSLILTDTGAHGYGLDAASRAAFLTTLGTFASHATVQGEVVDLAADANIQQLRADWAAARTCVAQANLVTDAIREVVQRFKTASGSFEYLINAGGDSVIPFRRVADWAEISRESRYNPPLATQTASEASLIADTFLNDDFYVASPIDGTNRTLYLPEAAVGRLVESVADVTAYIAMYLAAEGVASPTSALSSGYDFNMDLANYVTSQLSLRGLNVDSSLVSDTWSSADWRAKVLERAVSDAFGILSLQGHFSANRLVPADNGQRVLSTELAAIADGRFLKALVYSLGCHSGYSIVDADGTILTQVDAFPEVFVRKGATVVAGTGYQYGETVLMKNTEALIALLTDELGYSTSPTGASYAAGVPIGKALMQAKHAYMAQTATPRGIDLKVVGVSAVYGSPTMAFRLPTQQARPASGTLAPAPVTGFAGLTALDVATSDTLTPVTVSGATYYSANGATTTAPYRPIAPLSTVDANVAGSVLQGAVFLGGAYTESAFTPRLSIPATELTGEAPRYANDVFMPVIPVRTNLFDGDALQTIPFQYRSNADGTSGTARLFGSGVQVRAFWSSITGPSAAADAPAIRDVSLKLDTQGRLVVVATLRGVLDPGIAEVWLTYTDTTAAARSFASIPMVPVPGAAGDMNADAYGQGFTQLYTATLAGDPAAHHFLVQAVSGNGRVSAATNNGELYRFVAAPATPPAPPVDTRVASTLALSAPANATYRSTIIATATLTGAGQPLSGKTVTFSFGSSSRTAVTGANGVATATLDVNVTPRLAPYSLTASFAGDATAHGSAATANVTVGRAPTVLEGITASPQYSDGAPVARLTAHGLTLNEQAVVITRGGVGVATFTDFAGEVRFDTIDFGAGAGATSLTIEYPGNDRYAGATLTVNVPVQRENATLALTQLGPQPTGAITFTAQVTQAADGSLGDLRRATVAYTFTPASGTPVSASAPVDASGASSLTLTLPAGLYEVTAQVGGDFTSDVAGMALPVYDASAFVSGGGYVITGSDSYGVPIPAKASFGFVVKYGVDGTTATGNLNVHVKSRTGKDNDTDAQAKANGSLKFKATSFEWLVIAGSGAAFAGTGTVNGDAGYQFRVDVVDDGSSDIFVIHIWDAGSTYAAPDHIVRGTLGGGSIRIHR